MYMCRSLLIFSNVNFKMAARQPYWNFWFPDANFSLALNINCKLKWHNTYIYMGRSLVIFSDVIFKMAAWRPYWIFWFPELLHFGFEYQLQTSVAKYLCIWVRAYWFSVTSFSKWLPGGHIRFFKFSSQVCFGISVSIFMCMSFVAVGRSQTIVSYVAFKMAALWFWTMFNCNPPIAHCHPLLLGGGILVDHWSTVSSCGLVIPCSDIHLNQHWLRQWLVAWWLQAITWTKGYLPSIRYIQLHSSEGNYTRDTPILDHWN